MSVIKKADSGTSCRAIASEFGVGKTQVQTIVKEKEDIMKRWEEGERSNVKYCKPRIAGYCDLEIEEYTSEQ